jgi:hypothetical protein
MLWAAIITASRPEPQTLLMVLALSVRGQAGAEARLSGRVLAEPACSTHPMMHSSTWSFAAGTSSSTALIA